MNTTHPAPRGVLAAWIVRLGGAWLLLGAVAKLALGTPKDLPPAVIDIARSLSLTLDLTFRVVIAIELALVALCWLKPKLGWLPLALVLVFFDYVLTTQLTAGAESCGCFGASIKVDPKLMLAIDSVLLLALLAARPWRIDGPGKGAPWWLVPLAAVAGIAAPWVFIPKAGVGAPVAPSGANGGDGAPAVPPTTGRYVEPEPETWVGQLVYDVPELATLVDPALLPAEGKIVLWRQGCSHCAQHLRAMFAADDGSVPILLLQIQDDLQDSRAVDMLPEGPHVTRAEFPSEVQFVLETPWELVVAGGIVTEALGPSDLEHGDEAPPEDTGGDE